MGVLQHPEHPLGTPLHSTRSRPKMWYGHGRTGHIASYAYDQIVTPMTSISHCILGGSYVCYYLCGIHAIVAFLLHGIFLGLA